MLEDLEGHVLRQDFGLSPERPIASHAPVYNKGTSLKYDMHYPVELGIVISGKMHRKWPGLSRTLSPGDVWMCGLWEPHGWAVTNYPCNCLVLIGLPECLAHFRFEEQPKFHALDLFLLPNDRRPIINDPNEKKQLIEMGRRGRELLSSKEARTPWVNLRVRLLMLEILAFLQESRQALVDHSNRPPLEMYEHISAASKIVFSSNKHLTTQEVAQVCGIHRNTLTRIFQKVFGVSFAKFELLHRLEGACYAIRSCSDSLDVIAKEHGFTDASHLHHLFEKHMSVSPGTYRKNSLAITPNT